MKPWKVLYPNTFNSVNESARLTEFLRDFKSIEEQEDIYGDGLGMDVDDIQPKYVTLMVQHYPKVSDDSNKSPIAREIQLQLSLTISMLYTISARSR